MSLASDYGEIELVQIQNGDDFWALFEELVDDKSGFLGNKTYILEAYRTGNLFGLQICETSAMYERGALKDPIFCKSNNTFYLLPCFCIMREKTVEIIWTHSRARRMGFAKKLVELLHVEYAWNPLSESLGFWERLNIRPTTKL